MHRHLLCALAVICLIFHGCAQGNIVRLSYPEPGSAVSSGTGKRVCVVDFDNKRDRSEIGQRQSGESILGRTLVERWVAQGVAAELSHAGYAVSVVETLAEALAAEPDYIVTGEVEEVWLAESSLTRFTATIRASVSLLNGRGGDITSNNYNCVFSTALLPAYGVPQTLLDEALFELLQPAAQLLTQTMH